MAQMNYYLVDIPATKRDSTLQIVERLFTCETECNPVNMMQYIGQIRKLQKDLGPPI